jgi:hypothetical protein
MQKRLAEWNSTLSRKRLGSNQSLDEACRPESRQLSRVERCPYAGRPGGTSVAEGCPMHTPLPVIENTLKYSNSIWLRRSGQAQTSLPRGDLPTGIEPAKSRAERHATLTRLARRAHASARFAASRRSHP